MDTALAGSALIWAALALAILSVVTPERLSRRLLASAAMVSVAATAALAIALLTLDFSLAYVAETTSRATPWPYRLAAIWGGMDGSMLFYAALTLSVGYLGVRGKGRVERSVVAIAGAGALLVTLSFAHPFQALAVPAVDGDGLLAILQHPAMIYHPPILYLGLTSLVVPFALTMGGMSGGPPAQVGRPILLSWSLLTLGMLAGANWAYIELGWGGFWAWDPVENTALMPWLAMTAWLHVSKIGGGRMTRWARFLAVFPFALSVLGVYLTRSGVTGSIHSFAEDPVVGRVLLTAAALVTVASVVLVWRADPGNRWGRLHTGRETWLVTSAGLVVASLLFVLVGSAYPAYFQVFHDRALAVDTRFYVVTILPIAIAIAALTAFALRTRARSHGLTWGDALWFIALAVLVAVVGSVFAVERQPAAIPLLALAGAGVPLLTRDLIRNRGSRSAPAHLAHLGLALVLLGAAASALGTQFAGEMSIGEVRQVGPYQLKLVDIRTGGADRYLFAAAVFEIDGGARLEPQIRAYEDQGRPVAEPALRSDPLADLTIAISQLSPDAAGVELSVFVRPMVWWVWVGASLIAAAGSWGLVSRVGAGAGPRPPAREELPAGGTTSAATGR